MKHLYNIIKNAALVVCVGLLAASCADFLEIEPRDIVTEDNFWNLRYRVYNPNAAQSFFWGAEENDYSEFTLMDADGDGLDWMTTGYDGGPLPDPA